MATEITYVFSMQSPWTYLGHDAFMEIAKRRGAGIVYRPVPLGRVFAETGGVPVPKRHPVRQRYRLVELQRWRERRGLKLNLNPKFFPVDPSLADKLAIAISAEGGDPEPFMRSCFAAVWAEDRNLADPATIVRLVKATGVDPAALDRAASPETEARYEQNRIEAEAAGVFGAPAYVLNGEVFWGQDRLEMLDEALASGRPPFRP